MLTGCFNTGWTPQRFDYPEVTPGPFELKHVKPIPIIHSDGVNISELPELFATCLPRAIRIQV